VKLIDTLKTPGWIVFQLMEHCNLRCSMCYEWGDNGSYLDKKDLAILDLDTVLRTVRECLPASPKFEFFGGEPMLYPGIWEVVELIREGGAEISFPTNGTLLEAHAERMVAAAPNLVWVSVDGPRTINDRQRGEGVFERVTRGMQKVLELRSARKSIYPQLGITFVVTPDNYRYIEYFFRDSIDITTLACVSIELQSYTTQAQFDRYEKELQDNFGVASAPCAKGYIRDPSCFSGMDVETLTKQLQEVARLCAEHGVRFFSQPGTLTASNIRSYLSANWEQMEDRKSRCGVPWVCAEISAEGDVSTCHTFYDLPIGNIYEQSLIEVWNDKRLKKLQAYLRNQLFPICTACCRYYGGAGQNLS
jgi:radical SAM protein with 4Fe4S-binding SPASM domain